MRAWQSPIIDAVPSDANLDPGTAFVLHDERTGSLLPVAEGRATATMYVCGITPYDATHLGHAATYLTYDLVNRVARDCGKQVTYAQNVTDVDDPLLERAKDTAVSWLSLAEQETERFRRDMEYLGVIAPDAFIAVSERIVTIANAVSLLLQRGVAYAVPSDGAEDDLYFDVSAAAATGVWSVGSTTRFDHDQLILAFAEHGGDPDRIGKRDPLDPLLWRAARLGEPSWVVRDLPRGRPGWHIECAVIASERLGTPFDIQGGGSDLIFPHHDLSAGHVAALDHERMARIYSHTGMVALNGEKMSKSLGNLVFVSTVRDQGWDADALRVAVLGHHYRDDWEWFDGDLALADKRLRRWRLAYRATEHEVDPDATAVGTVRRLRAALRDDLDSPAAFRILDTWTHAPTSGPLIARAARALLGIDLAEQ